MQLQPKITFKVKTINYEELYSTLVPDENFNNILNNLRNQTVYIEGVDYSLKDGDEFTLYGKEAMYVYNLYVANPTQPNMILEITYFGPPTPTTTPEPTTTVAPTTTAAP